MNATKQLCPKSITIYHIVGKKVGSSSNIKQRLGRQGGHTQIEWEVLHEIEPNTMTLRDIWELECSEQARLGYQVEHEGNYQTFLRSNTNHSHQGKPWTEAQKKALSVAMSGENNPMFGKTGEDCPCYGRTGEAHPMFGLKAPNAKAYNIYSPEGSLFTYTDDPAGFAKENGLQKKALTHCASPKNKRRYITISDTKYTVSYAK